MATAREGLEPGPDGRLRCRWGLSAPEYVRYHDEEWGRPAIDDVRLFEKLSLEGFQAGLSWLTILRKRLANPAERKTRPSLRRTSCLRRKQQANPCYEGIKSWLYNFSCRWNLSRC